MSNSLTLTRRNCGQYIEKNMELPQNCRSISAETFFNRPDIRSVVFAYELEQFGNKAFQGCSLLNRIELPEHLQKLGIVVFSDCISLKKVKIPASLTSIPKNAFNNGRKLNSLEFAPNSKLTFIGPNAFSECATLTEVVFPASLEEIDDRAFYKCKKLSCISFPGGDLRVIGKQAFYFCGMDSLQLPDSLEVLDESAFFKCCNLTSVVIPPNVRYLGKWIFHGCNRLQYLEIRHDPEFIGEWIINKAATIRCYKGSKVDRYCQQSGFKVEYFS